MALTQEQLQEVERTRSVLNQERQPVDRKSEILNMVQSTRRQNQNKGFVADIKGIGTGIKEDLARRGTKMEEISALQEQGQGAGTSLFQRFGQFAGGVSDVIGQTVMGGLKALTPQPIQEAIGGAVQSGVEKVVDTDFAQSIIQSYQNADPTTQKNIDALLGIGSLATDVVGAGLAKKPVTQAVKKGVDVATDVARGTSQITKPIVDIAQGTATKLADTAQSLADVPSRIATNLAEDTAQRQSIKALNNPTLQKAARQGIEVQDLNVIKQVPKAERPALKKLHDVVIKFADGNTKTNPFEIVGAPIVKRLTTLDNQVKGFAKQLDGIAQSLKGKQVDDMSPILQRVSDSLNDLGVSFTPDGKLNLVGSQLEGLGNTGKIIENVFNRINRSRDAFDLHRLKKFIDENVSYGKRVEGLSGDAEKVLKNWRKTIDTLLDDKFPSYNKVNTELSKRIQPLNDLKDLLKNADGLDADLLSQKAGIIARRITSAAPSNPEIKQILRNLDRFTATKGKTAISTERLQDFYNILNKYYDIAPKTGFQNLVTEGVEKGTTALGAVLDPAKQLLSRTNAVRKKALEDALNELFR